MSLPLVSKGIEDLTAAQRACVEEYLAAAKIDGVVTSVLIGAEPWDLRPLIMENGRLELLRLIPPDLSRSPSLERIIAGLEKVSGDIDPDLLPITIQRSEAYAWLRRSYTPKVLSEVVNPFAAQGLEIEARSVRQFLEVFSRLFAQRLCHGNVTLSNIGFVNGRIIPLDMCLRTLSEDRSNVQSAEEDLRNIGKIFSLFKFLGCSPALVADLTALRSFEGSARSTLDALLEKFSLHTESRAHEVTDSIVSTSIPPVREQRQSRPQSPSADSRREKEPRDKKPPRDLTSEPRRTREDVVSEVREESSAGLARDTHRARVLLFGILLGFAAVAIFVFRSDRPFLSRRSPAEYAALWNSGDPTQVKEIIAEALEEPFADALEVIRKETLAGRKPEGVRVEIIKVAFDPQWFSALSENDRRTALSFALGDLVPSSDRRISPFPQLHPGVLLALAGMVNLEHPGEMFAGIALDKFFSLPKSIADVFRLMADNGVKELRDAPPRAFSHLYAGDGTISVFQSYFISAKNLGLLREQMRALQPILTKNPAYAKTLADWLTRSDLALASQFGWFEEEQSARWADAPPIARLSLMSGVMPSIDLSLEQYIDLLQFPLPEVRAASQDVLVKRFIADSYRSLLIVLASGENKLTRAQMIFLVSALQLPDEEAFAFFSRWFSGEPDPDTVFLILLARSRSQKAKPFDIEAARYLIDRQWSASVEEFAELVHHPEALARALAYSRLDPKKPSDMQILKAQLDREPSERIKGQIREKLGIGVK